MHGYFTVASTPQAYRFRLSSYRAVVGGYMSSGRFDTLEPALPPSGTPTGSPIPPCPLSLRRVIAAGHEVPHSYDIGALVLAPTIPGFPLELVLCGRPQRHRKQTTQSDGAVCLVQCSCPGSRQRRRRRHIMGPSARSFCPPTAILVRVPSRSLPHFLPTPSPFQA